MSVEGLRFVITGSATGIGEATARVAAARGASVMVTDVNDEGGEQVAKEIQRNPLCGDSRRWPLDQPDG